jgi:hypothetical protein
MNLDHVTWPFVAYAMARAALIGTAFWLLFQVMDITPVWTLLIGQAQGFYFGWRIKQAHIERTGIFAPHLDAPPDA